MGPCHFRRILFLYFLFLMASVTSRSPLSILNVPRRLPVEKKSPFARRRRFGGGLLYSTFLRRARRVLTGSSVNLVVSSPILRLRCICQCIYPTSRQNAVCFSIVGQDQRTPASGSVLASDAPPPRAYKRACDDAIQRVGPHVSSVDQTKPTTSIQIRLPDGSRDLHRDSFFVWLTNVSTCRVSSTFCATEWWPPLKFRHCVSGPSPYPRTILLCSVALKLDLEIEIDFS